MLTDVNPDTIKIELQQFWISSNFNQSIRMSKVYKNTQHFSKQFQSVIRLKKGTSQKVL